MKDMERTARLEELLVKAVNLAMHGNYENGVCSHGIDEGAIKSHEFLKEIIDDAIKLGVDINACTNSVQWVFTFFSEDPGVVLVSPSTYWEEKGFIPDYHVDDFVRIPAGWTECMEHTFERNPHIADEKEFVSTARKEFTMAGFKEVKWEDGELSRRKSSRREIGDEWDPCTDGPDPCEYDDLPCYLKAYEEFEKGNRK